MAVMTQDFLVAIHADLLYTGGLGSLSVIFDYAFENMIIPIIYSIIELHRLLKNQYLHVYVLLVLNLVSKVLIFFYI